MLRKLATKSFTEEPIDLTPVIDVVFLLIIFFMLVCQFMAAEQFKVAVPDEIKTARAQEQDKPPLTITVLLDDQQRAVCAVGSDRLAPVEGKDLELLIKSALDEQMGQDKTVRLRCDKRISFGQIKYILAGISESRAQQIDWAVLAK